jgi:hypothetical protein
LCLRAFLTAALALLVATAASAQTPAAQSASQDSTAGSSKTSKEPGKVKLLELTRVSTEEAARRAAQEKTKKTARQDSATKEDSKKSAPSGVSEFRPVTKPTGDSADAIEIPSQKSGKSPVKDVHGTVQGVSGSGTRAAGAEVGASSKGGKVHVYVETERSRSDTQPPH